MTKRHPQPGRPADHGSPPHAGAYPLPHAGAEHVACAVRYFHERHGVPLTEADAKAFLEAVMHFVHLTEIDPARRVGPADHTGATARTDITGLTEPENAALRPVRPQEQ